MKIQMSLEQLIINMKLNDISIYTISRVLNMLECEVNQILNTALNKVANGESISDDTEDYQESTESIYDTDNELEEDSNDKLTVEEFKRLYTKHKSLTGVAKELNMTARELDKYIVKNKIELNCKYPIDEIIEQFNDGKSPNVIAKNTGLSYNTVKSILVEHGVYEVREYKNKIDNSNDDRLIELYLSGEKKSVIARTLGMFSSQVSRRLRQLGYDTKPESEMTERERNVVENFKELGSVNQTHKKTKETKIYIENTLLRYGIKY